MFGTLGIWEILLIFLILVLLFGSRKLPEIGKGLGRAITNFKRGIKEEPQKIEESEEDEGEGPSEAENKGAKDQPAE